METTNLAYLAVSVLVGGGLGLAISIISADRLLAPPEVKDGSVLNIAAVYATLMLVIGSVVAEWPPGQEFPMWTGDIVFFGAVFLTSAIFVRLVILLAAVESPPDEN